MKINDIFLRITLLRFPLIIFVIMLHANATVYPVTNFGLEYYIRNYLSNSMASIAVPLFFTISGYLFFQSFEFSWYNYINKIKKRTSSLFIPYVFWNAMVLIVFLCVQNIPELSHFLSGQNKNILDYNVFDFINAFVGIGGYPIAYHFWFIRDLIFLVILSPILYIAISKFKFMSIAVPLFLWLFFENKFSFILIKPLLFFVLGGWASYWFKEKIISFIDEHFKITLFLFFISSNMNVITIGQSFHEIIHNLNIILGIKMVLSICKFAKDRVTLKLNDLSHMSFFVFALHEPLLTVCSRIFGKIFNHNILSTYIGPVIATIFICYFVHTILNRIAPNFLNVISGGR
ncbi:acyltransferase [Vibrio parahaemolyticus]|uniref:acyltransferase family protein n=1 Tax=Vibrio parahaemolyticus TaxID=670 RepID=UPI0004D62933|nr:acyltransferase [Vibrio parahaemolyticus]EGR0227645.1 acyltransferase [Vibrio parahaemolyticus]EGR1178352.1 hypothetical protein [Vibrio parahaemolyticus]EGR9056497.1 acyltransferase [Vibrio parahaemolyticus]EHD7138125.1 acyltransferase [Vibrio parahaemolyticus]EJU9074613.1 acyltransferase [Vibrio parahaemolyticus]